MADEIELLLPCPLCGAAGWRLLETHPPPRAGTFLIATKEGDVFESESWGDYQVHATVTHWMPLPRHPGQEGDG